MDPTVSTYSVVASWIWPLGTFVAPVIFFLLYRRARLNVAGTEGELSDVRVAAATLGAALGATSALAALIFAQSGFDDPSCLIELPPINGWGYLFWAIEITLVIAFLFWVWVGPGARQLATFLSGLSKKHPISQTLVKFGAAAMALGLIVIVCIEVARLVRPYCEAA